MAISTTDGLVNALGGAQRFNVYKASQTTEGAGTWHSYWKATGLPGAGSNPPAYTSGSGYTCTDATAGALSFTNPTGGQYSYLGRFYGTNTAVSTIILYDRLWTCSGFVTNSISAQTITTPGTIPSRDAKGLAEGWGVECWIEIYTAPGATGATWTVSYTDEANNAGNSGTYTHPANAETVGQMCPVTLAAGDQGVRAVASLTCSVSSGTAGDVGITLLRRLATITVPTANVGQTLDAIALGMPRIYDDSCLAVMIQASGTTGGVIVGGYNLIQG